MKPILILSQKCNHCGLCVTQCTSGRLEKTAEDILITEKDCIGCGHCYAICPQNAIVPENNQPIEPASHTQLDPKNFQAFLRFRRSHRLYQPKAISRQHVLQMLDFARYAPTGSNAQSLQYLFIQDPDKISLVRREIMKVYRRFHFIIQNPILRWLIALFDSRAKKKELRDSLAKMLARYQNHEDPLFHNAPLLVFVYAKKSESSTPKDDACYALYQMVLGAETLGIASCINGLSLIGLSQNRKLRKILGFTHGYKAYACCGFGYPLYNYKNLVFRKEPPVKFL